MSGLVRHRVRITGVVQGVGFRPFIWRRATRLGLGGWVENDAGGVTAEIAGAVDAVASFVDGLAAAAPPLARVEGVVVERVPDQGDAGTRFVILESTRDAATRPLVVPPDVAPCPACLAELADPADRRYRYPFLTCTDCGPRFTIIESLPYDRATTTMHSFAMCPACAAEYRDPANRRFHAQPIACPDCGPTAWFSAGGAGNSASHREDAACVGGAAVEAARDLLRAGGIVAVKGIGGFHLACDATNPAAVRLLRERKRRPRKPFAVMVADADAARGVAILDEQERRLLEGAERPIVMLHRSGPVAELVAPGNDFIGVMLPSSPLHELLVAGLPPLVMTSGNLAEEPLAVGNQEAAERLGTLADGFLMHDRDIHTACDDSVVRCVAGLPLPMRRSRGHCPLPIRLPSDGPTVLAVGGELKAAICVARGAEAVMGQHVGDMGNLETLEALDRTAAHLLTLLDAAPLAVVADLHPGYLSARWARQFATARRVPLLQVQHHESHVASLLAEHGLDLASAEGTIGVCFDGTGYGRDGTIQGGEVVVVRNGNFERVAHLHPFLLPGHDAAIRHPWRTALAVLHAAGVAWDDRLPCVAAASARDREVLARQIAGGFGCTPTTSMGRLFDAVASLVGLRHTIDYEAEAALNLEAAATAGGRTTRHAGGLIATEGVPLVLDWRPIVRGIAAELLTGTPREALAGAFHDAVVRLVVDACAAIRDRGASGAVGLTGGVFQNALLVERAVAAIQEAGFEPLVHHAVPPNDGGLALGQALLARAILASR
jgi:hydrogenase maturation protein HypF